MSHLKMKEKIKKYLIFYIMRFGISKMKNIYDMISKPRKSSYRKSESDPINSLDSYNLNETKIRLVFSYLKFTGRSY